MTERPRGERKKEASRPGVPIMIWGDWDTNVSYSVGVPDVTSIGRGKRAAGGGGGGDDEVDGVEGSTGGINEDRKIPKTSWICCASSLFHHQLCLYLENLASFEL